MSTLIDCPRYFLFSLGSCYGLSFAVIFILSKQWLSNGSSGMFDHSQLVEGTWPWAFEALCFSCGYFAYDQWDMLHYRLYNGLIPSILVHHLVLLICFTLALYRNVTINYLILTLICEVSTKSSSSLYVICPISNDMFAQNKLEYQN